MTKKWFLMVLFISLLAFPLMAMAQTPISYGQVVTGEITAEAPSVTYTFNSNFGDLITIRMSATGGSGLDSFVRLLDPNGVDFYSDDDSGGNRNALLGPITLSAGTYTIIASSCCDSSIANTTGTFELVVNLAQAPTLAVNQPIPFELNSANPVAFFNLLNDDITTKLARLTVTLANSNGVSLNVEVRGPIGNYYYSNYVPVGTTTYTVDPIIADLAGGANLVVVRAFSDSPDVTLFADNQALQAQITVTEVTATPLVSSISGTLDDANPTAYYSFEANMGDILRLFGEQPLDSHPINVMVYGNGGFGMMGGGTADYMTGGSTGNFVIDPLRIMNTGIYYVVVSRVVFDRPERVVGTVSNFSLSLGATDTPMLQPGVPVTGIFDNPDVFEYTYRYQATANQTIRITLKSLNNGYGPSFDMEGAVFESSMVIANMNSIAAGTISYDVLLYYDSVYIIRVRNGIFYDLGAGAGEFSLQVDVME
jgi:hypothetical protein